MTDVEEKDYTWYIVAGAIVVIVMTVIFLRGEKSAHLQSGTFQAMQTETFANIEKRKTQNNASESQKSGK